MERQARLIDANILKEEMVKDLANTMRMTEMHKGDMALRVLNRIDEAPTIEAEPVRHGTWIGIEYDGYADGCPVYDLWECSECKHEHKGEEDTLTDYCPDCGAKMDGKDTQ